MKDLQHSFMNICGYGPNALIRKSLML